VTWNSSTDAIFVQETKDEEQFFNTIYNKVELGTSEAAIRDILLCYTRRFVDASVGRGYFQNADEAANYGSNIKRRTLFWSASKACERWEASIDSRIVKDVAIDKAIQQFVYGSSLDEKEIVDLFGKLKSVSSSPEKIAEVRTLISHYGALSPIACCMMHSSRKVREFSRQFLYNMKYMDENDKDLNPMFKLIYRRLVSVKDD